MAELSALYADALFRLAVEDGTVDEVYEQAAYIRDLLKDADCRRIFVHPHISDADKRAFFEKVVDGGMNKDLFALLLLSVAKNRETHFIAAMKALITLIDRYKKKAVANVVTAVELKGGQLTALKKMLSDKLDKDIDIIVRVDASVIGGPFINVDGYYVDLTIKRKLHDLAADMKVGCGA